MPTSPMTNSPVSVSASSIKNSASGRGGSASGPDEAASAFGNLLAQEEEKATAFRTGSAGPGGNSGNSQPGADSVSDPANGGAGTGIGTTDKAAGSASEPERGENMETTDGRVDIALAALPAHGANMPVALVDPVAPGSPSAHGADGAYGAHAAYGGDAEAIVSDRPPGEISGVAPRPGERGVTAGEAMDAPPTEPAQRGESAILQSGRTTPAGTVAGAVPAAADLIRNMLPGAMVTTQTAAAGTAAAGAIAGNRTATGSIGTARPTAGTVGAMTIAPAMDARRDAWTTQAGRGIRLETAAALETMPGMESGLPAFGPAGGAGTVGGSGAAFAPENLPAASIATAQASSNPVAGSGLAPASGNALVPGLPGPEPLLGATGWDQALGQKVLWLVSHQQQVAELSLNPPDLGPLQVVLSMADDQLSATFVSQQADVRNALEAALPRLKEMMAENGINLSSTTVSSDSAQQQGRFERPSHPGGRYDRGEGHVAVPGSGISRHDAIAGGSGLVDTFA